MVTTQEIIFRLGHMVACPRRVSLVLESLRGRWDLFVATSHTLARNSEGSCKSVS